MEATALGDIQTALPYFLKHKTVWSSYDNEADVLYLHFKKPNHADNSKMTEDEIIIRYVSAPYNSSCISDIIRFGAKRRRRHSKTMRSSF
jgi:hypothetical protein